MCWRPSYLTLELFYSFFLGDLRLSSSFVIFSVYGCLAPAPLLCRNVVLIGMSIAPPSPGFFVSSRPDLRELITPLFIGSLIPSRLGIPIVFPLLKDLALAFVWPIPVCPLWASSLDLDAPLNFLSGSRVSPYENSTDSLSLSAIAHHFASTIKPFLCHVVNSAGYSPLDVKLPVPA